MQRTRRLFLFVADGGLRLLPLRAQRPRAHREKYGFWQQQGGWIQKAEVPACTTRAHALSVRERGEAAAAA